MREPFEFDQIYYNEVIYWLEMRWNRKLNDHEKSILLEGYKYGRTMQMVDQNLSEYHKQEAEKRQLSI